MPSIFISGTTWTKSGSKLDHMSETVDGISEQVVSDIPGGLQHSVHVQGTVVSTPMHTCNYETNVNMPDIRAESTNQ
jgi:hypothetical protein